MAMSRDAATNVWVSLPFNFGARLGDLAEWTEQWGLNTVSNYSYSGISSWQTPLVGAAATLGAVGVGWYIWSSSRAQNQIVPLVNPQRQTRILPDGSRICSYLKTDMLSARFQEEVRTVYDAIRRGARISSNGNMLGWRADASSEYQWLSYNEVIERSLDIGRSMRALGLPSGQETFIGIYSKNRPEWVIVEQATYAFNNVLVPLYDTLGIESSVFIINQADIKLVVCDTEKKALELIKKKSDCPTLCHIVVLDPELSDELKTKASEAGVNVLTFGQFERLSSINSEFSGLIPQPPKQTDLATICYTSGTTGVPKGVMLTHCNIIAETTVLDFFKHVKLQSSDVMFSFLPLAHMFERVMQTSIYSEGGSVGFFRGDIRRLIDDLQALRPTILPVVPRVLNRVYDKVMAEVNSSSMKKFFFDTAMTVKQREISSWIVRNDGIFDRVVFKKIRDGFGGRVRFVVTGSAPLAPNVLTFIRCALGCIVCEGYGQTECVAACTMTIEGDSTPDHVGIPFPCSAIKLIDVPELNYFAKNNEGEVCVKGLNVFKGYYKNPEQTAETLDKDGWLHTGDIGRWTNQGTLKIVDRKKHIFKLAQGEYVAPEKIENVYTRSKFVSQCFIHGESLKTSLVGVIVPDAEVLPSALASMAELRDKVQGKSFTELCTMDEVKQVILLDICEIGKQAGLFSFEQAKNIVLSAEQFTVENDLLTPTLKSKRPQLKRHFAAEIAGMYTNLS